MKWLEGNTLRLSVPLKLKTAQEGSFVETDYVPPTGSVVRAFIVSRYKKYEYDCVVNGNVVSFVDHGTIPANTYGMEIRVVEPSRNLRSFKCGILEMLSSDEDIELGEFVDDGNVLLDAAYFIQGEPGKSAYQVAVENGFVGTEAEWLESLIGPQGEQGIQGPQGVQGEKGDRGDLIYPYFSINEEGHLIAEGGVEGMFTLENLHLFYNFQI